MDNSIEKLRYYAITYAAIQINPAKIVTNTALVLSPESKSSIEHYCLLKCIKEWPSNNYYGHLVTVVCETDSQREDFMKGKTERRIL